MTGRIAAFFLLGSGINGMLLFVLGVAGVPLVRVTFLASLMATVLLCWTARHYVPRAEASAPAVLVLALPFAVALYLAGTRPLRDYDGRLTWMPKAEAIAREASIRGPFFHGERGLNLHNHYPLLVRLDVATLGTRAARFWYCLMPLAALLWCCAAIRERHGALASWLVATAAWLPRIVTAPEGGALSAYSDLSVMAFFGAAAISLPNPALTGIWLACLVLTKNEGLLLALCLLVAAARGRRSIAMIVPPLAAAALLAVWRTSIPAAYDEQYSALFRELPSQWPRLAESISALAQHAIDLRTWGLFWIVAAIAIAIGVFRRNPIAVATLLALGGYSMTFAVTSWNINELARVSAHRLLTHLLVPALLVIAAMLTPSPSAQQSK